jgi:AraC-like DNA-binding protein
MDLGALRFTFASHGLALYPPGATFGPRTLGDFEFVWIVAGEVVWHCDGADHAAPPGTVILARPGMRDGFTWDPRSATRHGFIHFSVAPAALARAGLPAQEAWPRVIRPAADGVLAPLFHHLDWLLSTRPEHWQALADNALRQALAGFVTGSLDALSEAGAPLHPLIAKVLDHVHERWADGTCDAPTLGDLARVAGVSRAHLARVFRAHLGATPVDALRSLRLERAAQLLARTNLSVGGIAEQCAFGHAFHFSRRFRQAYGFSPRAFRQRLATGGMMPTSGLLRERELTARLWRNPAAPAR